jgi:hypothetical protein
MALTGSWHAGKCTSPDRIRKCFEMPTKASELAGLSLDTELASRWLLRGSPRFDDSHEFQMLGRAVP